MNAATFVRLERLVFERAKAGRDRSAVAWAEVAAAFAWRNPVGQLRSPTIERGLARVAHRIASPPLSVSQAARSRRQVLHVISQGYGTGGHTRLALRWAETDTGSSSSFVFTRSSQVPDVVDMVRRGGSRVEILDSEDPLARAARLRALARGVDFVVCHAHPDDPVPALAFSAGLAGVPVVAMNHADHTFWLAPGAISALVHVAEVGVHLSVEARSYPDQRCIVLPIPVPVHPRVTAPQEARHRLGIRPGLVVGVTMASAPKFRETVSHPGFAQVVEPVLEAEPAFMLIAVGPSQADGGWRLLADRFGDRVRVVGNQADPAVFLDAADIYLNSFPWSSTTAALEGAARQIPVLSMRAHRGLLRVFSKADPALGDVELWASTPGDYRALLTRLVRDTDRRLDVGLRISNALRASRDPAAWSRHLERVYEMSASLEPLVDCTEVPTRSDPRMVEYGTTLMDLTVRESLEKILWRRRHLLDRRDRLACGFRARLRRLFSNASAIPRA